VRAQGSGACAWAQAARGAGVCAWGLACAETLVDFLGFFAGAVHKRCDGRANLPEQCRKGALVGQICRSRAGKVRWAGKFAGAVHKRCAGRANLPEPCQKGAMGRQICRGRAEKVRWAGKFAGARAQKVRWVGKFAEPAPGAWPVVGPGRRRRGVRRRKRARMRAHARACARACARPARPARSARRRGLAGEESLAPLLSATRYLSRYLGNNRWLE